MYMECAEPVRINLKQAVWDSRESISSLTPADDIFMHKNPIIFYDGQDVYAGKWTSMGDFLGMGKRIEFVPDTMLGIIKKAYANE